AFRCSGVDYIKRQLTLCKVVQQWRVFQTLSPLIRHVRKYEKARKNGRSGDYVSQNGDVVVAGNKFNRDIWSKLILLDPSLSPKTNTTNGLYHFTIRDKLDSTCFEFKKDHAVMEKLDSLVQLMFHGIGFGAMRHSEIKEMEECGRPRFFNGEIWYSAEGFKRSNVFRTSNGFVERRLPWSLSRLYLLYLLAKEETGYCSVDGLKPTHMAQEIFQLDTLPK
ncbi:unnamed protein product, partial [Cylindrotheca closterium]